MTTVAFRRALIKVRPITLVWSLWHYLQVLTSLEGDLLSLETTTTAAATEAAATATTTATAATATEATTAAAATTATAEAATATATATTAATTESTLTGRTLAGIVQANSTGTTALANVATVLGLEGTLRILDAVEGHISETLAIARLPVKVLDIDQEGSVVWGVDSLVSGQAQVLDLSGIGEESSDNFLVSLERQVADEESVALGAGGVTVLLGAVASTSTSIVVGGARLGEVNVHSAALELITLHLLVRGLASLVAAEVDVAEALGSLELTVGDDAGTLDTLAVLEGFVEDVVVDTPAQVADEQSGGLRAVRLGLLGGSGLLVISLALLGGSLGLLLLLLLRLVRIVAVIAVVGILLIVIGVGRLVVMRVSKGKIMCLGWRVRTSLVTFWALAVAVAAFFKASSSLSLSESSSSSESESESSEDSSTFLASAFLALPLVAGAAAALPLALALAALGAGFSSSEDSEESESEASDSSSSSSSLSEDSDSDSTFLLFFLSLPKGLTATSLTTFLDLVTPASLTGEALVALATLVDCLTLLPIVKMIAGVMKERVYGKGRRDGGGKTTQCEPRRKVTYLTWTEPNQVFFFYW